MNKYLQQHIKKKVFNVKVKWMVNNKIVKDFLIIQACGHDDEILEIQNIKSLTKLYGMNTNVVTIENYNSLQDALISNGKFDYIYLSSHGNNEGFCNEGETLYVKWLDFGELICSSDCLKSNSILLLSCCRGGLNEVAYDMFWNCLKIEYIVGPRQSLTSADMLIGFHLLLYNLEHRGIDPIVSCDKVLKGTDIRFKCFDRMETQSDPAFISRCNELNNQLNSK